MNFMQAMDEEIAKARRKHGNMHSFHEAYAVIQEEVDEFWDLVKEQAPSREKMLAELVQIAAMCRRAAEDLNLV